MLPKLKGMKYVKRRADEIRHRKFGLWEYSGNCRNNVFVLLAVYRQEWVVSKEHFIDLINRHGRELYSPFFRWDNLRIGGFYYRRYILIL